MAYLTKCEYKDTLRGCIGNGVIENQVIVHYTLREYDNLFLCKACKDRLVQEATKDGFRPYVHEAKERFNG